MNAILSLTRHLAAHGCTFSLVGAGHLLLSRTNDFVAVYENVRAVDDICFLTVFKDGEKIGRATLLQDGYHTCSPMENVVDFASTHPLFEEWSNEFYATGGHE